MATVFAKRWKVIAPLKEGGQGIVYKVEDQTGDAGVCVLKRLKNSKRLKRFRDEIEAILKVKHNGVIKLIDADLDHDPPFLVMELCEPGELTPELISPLSTSEKLVLFSRVCSAVGHAHSKGVIHRDIKPPNILLRGTWEVPVVADFGICIRTDEGLERLTEINEAVGARYYMAPELADGPLENVTSACDVYSLGKLLYWLLGGRIFDREKQNNPEWDLRIQAGEDVIHTIYDEIFPRTIVEQRENRFEDANELGIAIEKIIEMVSNNGRYLDADVPSGCLFCGIGKYSKKSILPRITALPFQEHIQQTRNYQLDYPNPLGSGKTDSVNLPQGNIQQHLYQRFLILECDHCGNLQFFKFEGNDKPVWKNTLPKVN